MAYVKTIWKEQIVQNPDAYNVIDNVDGTKTITPSFGDVIQEGTPISPENLQKIEDELEKLSEGGGTGGGHKILDKNGLELPQQPNLQFIGTGVTKIINDEIEKATVVEIAGEKGDDGVGIKSTISTYQISSNGTIIPTGAWLDNIPTLKKGKYLWVKLVQVLTDDSLLPAYYFSICQGQDGVKGDSGNDGIGVQSASSTYQVSISGTVIPTGTWEDSIPSVPKGQYLWTRTIITLTDNSTIQPYYAVSYQGLDGLGNGDMTKAIYDKNNSGKVDMAKDSELLNGKNESQLDVKNASTVNNKTVARDVELNEYTNHQIDQAIQNVVDNQSTINTGLQGNIETLSEQIANKLDRPKEVSATLLSSGWTGSTAPYTYTLTGITEIKSSKTLGELVYTKQGATTDANYLIWKNAIESADIQFVNELQDVGKLVLKAWGTKPTIDLPILLLIGGEEA